MTKKANYKEIERRNACEREREKEIERKLEIKIRDSKKKSVGVLSYVISSRPPRDLF